MAERPAVGEHTGRQVATHGMTIPQLQWLSACYDTYRRIRKDPTVALARALAIAPIVAAHWSVEADDDVELNGTPMDSVVEFIQKQFIPIRQLFLTTALLAGIDFGHQVFEKVFWIDANGRLTVRKFKPLLQDITEILTDENTGAYAGVKNRGTEVPVANTLLIPFRVEGSNWYGEPLLENVRETWNQWREANEGASRYDKKIAGSHLLVEYPPGYSKDQNGQERENSLIADDLCKQFESCSSIAVARDMAAFVEQFTIDNPGWKISLLEDSGGRQPTFIERLRYLDSLKCRAILIPERSVTEGQYGTKAEAGEQIDLALTLCDLTHQEMTRLVNWHAVDQLLALNWGEAARGKVRLKAAPVCDANLAFLRTVYQAVLENPSGFLEEYGQIDTDAMKDNLGVPKSAEVAQAGKSTAEADSSSPLLDMVGGITGMLEMFRQYKEGIISEETLRQQIMLFFKVDEAKARAIVSERLGSPTVVPLPGVEADAKVAATVRRIYTRLGIGENS